MAYGNFGGFGGGNMNQLIMQAQKMQKDMQEKKAKRDATVFKSSVGGGMVEVEMTGNKRLQSINIKDEVVDVDDKEMLQDLIISAINDVLAQIRKQEEEDMPQAGGLF